MTEPLSPATAFFLLVDHQTGVFERVVKAPPREQVEVNVLRLAGAAAIFEISAIVTTSEEAGVNGPLLLTLEQILPDPYANRIDRHGIIDSLADPAVAEALSATGRRQLVAAGIGTEVCGVAPALSRPSRRLPGRIRSRRLRLGDCARARRLAAADGEGGGTLTTTASVSAELAATIQGTPRSCAAEASASAHTDRR